MKIDPLVLLLAGALVGALAWGNVMRGRASDEGAKLDAALASHRDSAAQWDKARQVLTVSLGALRRDSSTLARNLTLAAGAAQRASRRSDSLLALIPDTLRVAVRLTFDSLAGEAIACRDLLVNCELRAFNAEARAHGDSTQLFHADSLLTVTEASWHTEQRKNRPGFLGLRSFWHARSWTIPLAAVTTLLLLRR